MILKTKEARKYIKEMRHPCPRCGKRKWERITSHKSKCKGCGYVQREMV